MTVYCADCDHVLEDTRRLEPWRWLCIKHPNISDGFGWVTATSWDKAPPYLYCKNVNGGLCPLFEPKRGDDDATGTSDPAVCEPGETG